MDLNIFRNVLCPDFFTIRKEGPGGEDLTDADLQLTVKCESGFNFCCNASFSLISYRQMLYAARGALSPSKLSKGWPDGILLQRQILGADSNTDESKPYSIRISIFIYTFRFILVQARTRRISSRYSTMVRSNRAASTLRKSCSSR